MKTFIQSFFYGSALVALLVLAGCDWGKKEGACSCPMYAHSTEKVQASDGFIPVKLEGSGDKIIATIAGKPLMTLKSFEREFAQIVDENPQLKQMAQFIPDLKSNVMNSLVGQAVMDIYINKVGIAKQADYQDELSRMMVAVKRSLNRKYFTKQFPYSVTDAEIKTFYQENKDKVPGLVMSAGGVKSVGVKFADKAAAQAFYDGVKANPAKFDAVAKERGLTEKVEDFKVVNEQSAGVNPVLRKRIVAITTVPSAEMVNVSDKEIWVIKASEKEEKQYRPFEEVKDYLRNDLERSKEMKAIEEQVEKLKKEYDVSIDEAVAATLKPKAPSKEEIMAQLEAQKTLQEVNTAQADAPEAPVAKIAKTA